MTATARPLELESVYIPYDIIHYGHPRRSCNARSTLSSLWTLSDSVVTPVTCTHYSSSTYIPVLCICHILRTVQSLTRARKLPCKVSAAVQVIRHLVLLPFLSPIWQDPSEYTWTPPPSCNTDHPRGASEKEHRSCHNLTPEGRARCPVIDETWKHRAKCSSSGCPCAQASDWESCSELLAQVYTHKYG